MSTADESELEARVARLESLVETLVARGQEQHSRTQQARPEAQAEPARREESKQRDSGQRNSGQQDPTLQQPSFAQPKSNPFANLTFEVVLARSGILFVVLAMAFLLKMSFDQGWITPALRLAFGGAASVALIAIGLRLEANRARLSQALLGGGIATLYLTGFASFQLYELAPFWMAMSMMSATTVLAIALSERQDSPFLAVLGTLGGLTTPILLNTGSGNIPGLAIYATVVLIGASVVQFHRGWASLLVTEILGGFVLLLIVAIEVDSAALYPALVAMASIAVYWIVGAGLPLLQPLIGPMKERAETTRSLWITRLAVWFTTFSVCLMISLAFDLDYIPIGLVFTGFALLLVSLAYKTRGIRGTAWPAAEVGACSLAAALGFLLHSPTALLFVGMEVTLLFYLSHQTQFKSLNPLAHLIMIWLAAGFLGTAAGSQTGMFLGLRDGAFARLGLLGMTVLSASWMEEKARPLYKGVAYVGLLIWFATELGPLTNGLGLISVAWSAQGAVALLAYLKTGSRALRIAGFGTLALVAGKLLLIDLTELDPAIRVMIFLGFGVALLALAYLSNKPKRDVEPS